ncbi:MAG: site-specific integrase, partial [Chitinophagaceae bacterium]
TKQSGTIERDVRVLKWLYEWADLRGFDIEERLSKGETLNISDVTSFCRHLRAKRSDKITGNINLQGKELVGILTPATFSSYIAVIEDFLIWAANLYIPKTAPTEEIKKTVENAKESLRNAFRSNHIGGESAPRQGLALEEVAELREVIRPGARRNPFKAKLQFRNYLIIELMLATGIRRGEVLKIKLSHLPHGPKVTLTIERSSDDPLDTRRKEPKVKTLGREIPIPRWLAKALWEYARKSRKKGHHPYLFTSNLDGAPLSLDAINYIFSHLVKKCFPHLKDQLYPHILRHTFNSGIQGKGTELCWDEEQIKKVQRYLGGWTEQSAMPDRYARRFIEAKALEVAEKYQAALYAEEVLYPEQIF